MGIRVEGGDMPEISHEQPDHALAEAARGFCAKEDREDGPMVLTGPHAAPHV